MWMWPDGWICWMTLFHSCSAGYVGDISDLHAWMNELHVLSTPPTTFSSKECWNPVGLSLTRMLRGMCMQHDASVAVCILSPSIRHDVIIHLMNEWCGPPTMHSCSSSIMPGVGFCVLTQGGLRAIYLSICPCAFQWTQNFHIAPRVEGNLVHFHQHVFCSITCVWNQLHYEEL